MRAFLVLIICIFLVAIGVAVIGYSTCNEEPIKSSESSETAKYKEQYCTSPYAAIKVGLVESWGFAKGNHDEIIAVGTVFIAIFTIVLGLFTVSLAGATNKLVKGAERTERRQLRAYVGMHEIETELPNLKKLHYEIPDIGSFPAGFIHEDLVAVTIKNYGQTPARKVLTVINWQPIVPFGATLPDDWDYRDTDSLNTIANAARPIIDRGNTYFTTINLNKLISFRHAHDKRCSLYFYGHIDYTDIYDRRWRREFCYVWTPWRPKGNRFIPYREHNSEHEIGIDDPGIFPTP